MSTSLEAWLREWLAIQREWEFWKHEANYLSFEPMPVQRDFLSSRSKITFLCGGNRSGKTIAGAANAALLANGVKGLLYPGFPASGDPTRGWAIGIDYKVADAMITRLRRMLGTSLKKFFKAEMVFELRNGSTIHVKSENLGYTRFQAQDIDWAWKDEAGDDKSEKIVQETLRGLVDRNGPLFVTMTPTLGTGWIGPVYYEPWAQATRDRGGPASIGGYEVEFFFADVANNIHIDDRARKAFIDSLATDSQRQIRRFGRFISLTGNVFPTFSESRHVIPPEPILPEWHKFRGLDFGLVAPTVCLWAAVKPVEPHRGLHIYREVYDTRQGKTAAMSADLIRSLSADETYQHTLLDPSAWNRHPSNDSVGGFFVVADEFARCGLLCEKANNEVDVSIERLWNFLGDDQTTPRLWIHDGAAPNLVRELRRLTWKDGQDLSSMHLKPSERIDPSKPDHAIDALRYIVMANPTGEFPSGEWWSDDLQNDNSSGLFEAYEKEDGSVAYRRRPRMTPCF